MTETLEPSGAPITDEARSTAAASGGKAEALKPVLCVKGIEVAYGQTIALRDIDLVVNRGEAVSVIGANGAGKTTLLRSISGLLPARKGSIELDGRDITKSPSHAIAGLGLRLVPEGRGIFPDLTVHENLLVGAHTLLGRRGGQAMAKDRADRFYDQFPALARRTQAQAGNLSGGEQQMLALARALMSDPSILLLDEPSTGLAPIIVDEIFAALSVLRSNGLTVLLVEQIATKALAFADRAYVIELARVTLSGPASELAHNPHVVAAYLGGSVKTRQEAD